MNQNQHSIVDQYEVASNLRSAVVPLARLLRQQLGGRLTATQASVLGSVSRCGPISLGALAAREQLSPPMISKVIGTLGEDGLVERVRDPHDGRVTLVQLTPEGREWLAEGRMVRDRWLAERLAGLDPAQRGAIVGAIPALEALATE